MPAAKNGKGLGVKRFTELCRKLGGRIERTVYGEACIIPAGRVTPELLEEARREDKAIILEDYDALLKWSAGHWRVTMSKHTEAIDIPADTALLSLHYDAKHGTWIEAVAAWHTYNPPNPRDVKETLDKLHKMIQRLARKP